MKLLLTVCFIAVIGTTFGFIAELFRENYVQSGECTENIYVNYFGEATIFIVNVNDHILNKMGAQPKLLRGGPGYTYINIVLEGRGHGINSTVIIYGEPLMK